MDDAARRARWRRDPFFYAALFVVGLALWARFDLIASRGTYPVHRDERHLTTHAFEMLRTGDPNPHFFKYGSLPIYLTAAAMGAGVVVAKLDGSLNGIEEITSVYHPYYSHPGVSLFPRYLFAFISALALFALGAMARHAFDHRALWVAAPCALLCSNLFLWSSWGYLNVDVIATAMCLGALAHLMVTRDSAALLHRAIIPALFCGAVTATKYNSGVLGIPFVLAILLGPKALRLPQLAWLFGLSLLAYAICSPFSFLDHTHFLSDIRYEMDHYRTGHAGSDGDPGLPQLRFYWSILLKDFGGELVALGILGMLYGAVTRPRNTLLLLSFPVAMLLHMATNRVHFPRTVLPAYAVFAAFIGLGATGLVVLAGRLGERVQARIVSADGAVGRLPRYAGSLFAPTMGLVVSMWLVKAGVIEQVRSAHTATTDQRIVLSDWLVQHAPAHCLLLVPSDVPFDPRPLAGRCQVRSVDLKHPKTVAGLRDEVRGNAAGATLLAYPRWDRRGRQDEISCANGWDRWLKQLQVSEPLLSLKSNPIPCVPGAPLLRNPFLALHRVTAWN